MIKTTAGLENYLLILLSMNNNVQYMKSQRMHSW